MKIFSQLMLVMCFVFNACTPQAPHVIAGDIFIGKFARRSYQRNDLGLLGSGGGFYGKDIQELFFHFYLYRNLNLEEARKLLVETIEDLVEQINSDPNLQSHLQKTPFDYKDVEVFISFYTSQRHLLGPSDVAVVYLSEGIVSYRTFNIERDNLERLHDESYECARDIIEHQ